MRLRTNSLREQDLEGHPFGDREATRQLAVPGFETEMELKDAVLEIRIRQGTMAYEDRSDGVGYNSHQNTICVEQAGSMAKDDRFHIRIR